MMAICLVQLSTAKSLGNVLIGHLDDAADAVAGVHVLECLVDARRRQLLSMRDELVDL